MKTITTPQGKVIVAESAEIKEGDYVFSTAKNRVLKTQYKTKDGFYNRAKIIATINYSISLDVPMVIVEDIKKLALIAYPIHIIDGDGAGVQDFNFEDRCVWIEGYKAAQQKGVYSEADLRNTFQAGAMYCATEGKAYPRSPNIESIIESLNQDNIELEMQAECCKKYTLCNTNCRYDKDTVWKIKTTRVDGQLMAYVKQ